MKMMNLKESINAEAIDYLYFNDDLFKRKDVKFIKNTILGLSRGELMTISNSNPTTKKYEHKDQPIR